MKTIILSLLISTQMTLSQWKKLDAPQRVTVVSNVQVFQGVFYATHSDRLYKSNDEGQTWEEINTNLKDFETFKHIYKLQIYDGVFYAISAQQLNTIYESDLYISNDLGVTWEKIKIGSGQLDYFQKIENDFYIYSPKSPRGILTSKDAKNWELLDINEPINPLSKYNKLYKTNDTIIVYQYGFDTDDGNPKYNFIKASIDNGNTWVTKGETLPNLGVKYLEKIGNILIAGTRSGVFLSDDFGETWLLSNGVLPQESRSVNEMLVVDDIIYYGAPKGFWKSLDSAKTWELVNNSLSNAGFYSLVLQDGYFFTYISNVVNSIQHTLISKDNFNSYYTLNFTSNLSISNFSNEESGYYGTFEGIYTNDNNSNSFELISDFFQHKAEPISKLFKKDNILICHYGGRPFSSTNFSIISTDYGTTWELIDYKKPNKINFIGYYINPDNRIFTITQNFGILYSDDLGKTWEEIEIDENTKIRLASIKSLNTKGNYFVENDSIFLYSTGIIYKTDQNFSELTDIINRQDTSLLRIFLNKDINYFAKYENFVAISNASDNYIYFSYDYGKSWERCNYDFEIDSPRYSDKLIYDIVNVDSNLIVSTFHGIYLSTDYGKNWTDMRYNLPKISEGTKYLYRFKNKLYLSMGSLGFYELDLKELGIASVENRNILYQYPPFPQPSTTSVNIKTFWDAGVINFTEEDIEIYNLNGEKLITKDKIKINKEAQNIGTITWDNSGVEPGIYIMKTKHGTETLITKIMVVK